MVKFLSEVFSLSNGGKMVFSQLTSKENVLISYDEDPTVHDLFHTYLVNGLQNNQTCLYVFDEKNNKVDLSWAKKQGIALWPLNKTRDGDSLSKLKEFLKDLYGLTERKAYNTRVLLNWGVPQRYGVSLDSILSCIRELLQLQKQPWKREFKAYGVVTKHTNVNAFDASSLDECSFSELAPLHKKIFFASKAGSFASLPSIGGHGRSKPRIKYVPENVMEYVAKRNLEVIVLSVLKDKPACGYDVIKRVFKHFRVLIPQGTIYALLYSLEQEGIIKTNNIAKEKIYEITSEGKEKVRARLSNSVESYRYLLSFLNNT